MTAEEVYKRLESEIILGILMPRERLIEGELCRKMKISRTLLREVFRRLEGVGLVSFQRNRGVAVRDFSQEEIEQVYFVRSILEKAAAPLIVQNITTEGLKRLRSLNHEFEEASLNADIGRMILANLSFHRGIWRITGNVFLCRMLQISQLHTDQVRYIIWSDTERIQRSVKEHREMLSGLAERDRTKYEEAVESQLDGAQTDYRRVFSVQSKWQSGSDGVTALKSSEVTLPALQEVPDDLRVIRL